MKRYNSKYSNNRNSSYTPRSIKKVESKARRNLLISLGVTLILTIFMVTWGIPTLIGGLSFLNKFKAVESQGPMEDNIAIAPPVLNIPFESTNSAQIRISGISTPLSKVEIYIDEAVVTTVDTNSDGSFLTEELQLTTGTNNIYGKTIEGSGKKSLSSKTIRLVYSNALPKLEISEPGDNTEIKGGDQKVKVAGVTDPENTIMVNGQSAIVNFEGKFSTIINLNEGDNFLVISATNAVGNKTEAERKVTYIKQ